MNTVIEHDEETLPLHHLIERDYIQTLGLMLHIDASPGLFGDLTESMRPDGSGWKRRALSWSRSRMVNISMSPPG